jgi:hypothetical protein
MTTVRPIQMPQARLSTQKRREVFLLAVRIIPGHLASGAQRME